MRILIVDSSVAVRERLLDLLRASPGVGQVGRVWQAADATGALALVREEAVYVALVDLAFGQQSGLDLIRDLRAQCSSMLLVVLTNSSTDLYREACLRRGAAADCKPSPAAARA